jgi:hypothetical protein
MGHKCFISFKTEDAEYKRQIQEDMDIDLIDKSLNEAINSDDEEYIMKKIREDYLSDSTVTLHLIGTKSSENNAFENQTYIKRELQASLYNGEGNTRNGILGVVLPEMIDKIYKGEYDCITCESKHNYVNIDNNTTIREFNYNYYIPKDSGCAWTEDDRYCVLVKWDDFKKEPEKFIDKAYEKKFAEIKDKVRVFPK